MSNNVKIPKCGLQHPRYWREAKSCNHSAVPVMAAHYKYSNHDSSLTLPGCCASFHSSHLQILLTDDCTPHRGPVTHCASDKPKTWVLLSCVIHLHVECSCYTPYSCCCYTLVIPSPVRARSVLHPMLPCVPVTPYLQSLRRYRSG